MQKLMGFCYPDQKKKAGGQEKDCEMAARRKQDKTKQDKNKQTKTKKKHGVPSYFIICLLWLRFYRLTRIANVRKDYRDNIGRVHCSIISSLGPSFNVH